MTLKWHGYVLLALVAAFGATPSAQAQKMYWSRSIAILRADLDGSNVETIHPATPVPELVVSLALDLQNEHLYWTGDASQAIRRSDLDGSDIETLVVNASVFGIALDVASGKMYWTEGAHRIGPPAIRRANLNGTQIESLITDGIADPRGLALDLVNGKMYWAEAFRIQRANLDGSNIEEVIPPSLRSQLSVALDVPAGKIYWTERYELSLPIFVAGRLRRANLDGSRVEDLFIAGSASGFACPGGLALDVDNRKIFWTSIRGGIQSANLDGSDHVVIRPQESTTLQGIALDLRDPNAIPNPVPSVSTWGLLVMTFLLLAMARMSSLRRLRSADAR